MIETAVQHWPLLPALALAGIAAGLVAGLFGIGGGVVIVPVLFFLFTGLGFEEQAMHVAVATSLATIIVTSARSVMAHNARGAVDWHIVRTWSPWIILGATSGMVLAGYVPGRWLTLLFGAMAFLLAAQLFFGRPNWKLAETLPSGAGRAGLGATIGSLSALMGIGGGTFGVSLLTVYGRAIHQAVATAAGFGVAIGVPSAIAAVLTGWGRSDLPPFSAGFVNLPAFATISVFTVAMAPVGARLAHTLDASILRRAFGIVLALVGSRMLYTGAFS
ncbi:MAG: sulfite exporter TauE/SafE family protein [Pseudomonadota bacterium]